MDDRMRLRVLDHCRRRASHVRALNRG
jgi:hypothetical protein